MGLPEKDVCISPEKTLMAHTFPKWSDHLHLSLDMSYIILFCLDIDLETPLNYTLEEQ